MTQTFSKPKATSTKLGIGISLFNAGCDQSVCLRPNHKCQFRRTHMAISESKHVMHCCGLTTRGKAKLDDERAAAAAAGADSAEIIRPAD